MLAETDRLVVARDVLREAISTSTVPGAVALVRQRGVTVLHEAVGAAMLEPEHRVMQRDTVFDVASLTKPLATTPVILHLVEAGLLDLAAPVGNFLPKHRDSPLAASTIQQLLTHASGLPAHVPLYFQARGTEDVFNLITSLELNSFPGTQVEYSCLGFILLGIIAERITGEALDQLTDERVFRPLGLRRTGFCPSFSPDAYAATERGNEFERNGAAGYNGTFDDWRADYVPGAVHDGNAWYAMAGVSGNAGLFSIAEEVGILGQMWLDGGEYGGTRVLKPETVELATTDLTPALDIGRGLGWQIARRPPAGASGPFSSGTLLSPRAYGHTGFTGTSIWIDPDDELVIVLLTNRVHPVAGDATSCIALRHRFHDAVARELKGLPSEAA